MELSKNNAAVIRAFERGYCIDRAGNVYGLSGQIKKKRKHQDRYVVKVTLGPRSLGTDRERMVMVHKLQGYAKFGAAIFEEGIHIRHLDSDPTNNTWDNIGIGDAHDNAMDIAREIRVERARKGARALQKLTEEQVREARRLDGKGVSRKELCAKYGVHKSTLSDIINRKQYAWVE